MTLPARGKLRRWLGVTDTAVVVRRFKKCGVTITGATVRNWRRGTTPPHPRYFYALRRIAALDGVVLSHDDLLPAGKP